MPRAAKTRELLRPASNRQLWRLEHAWQAEEAVESFGVAAATGDQFRVVAENTVGDTFNYSNPGTNEIPTFPGDTGFPHVTATSLSNVVSVV